MNRRQRRNKKIFKNKILILKGLQGGALLLICAKKFFKINFDFELGVFKGLALLQSYAKRFFKINFDFELGVFKGLAP